MVLLSGIHASIVLEDYFSEPAAHFLCESSCVTSVALRPSPLATFSVACNAAEVSKANLVQSDFHPLFNARILKWDDLHMPLVKRIDRQNFVLKTPQLCRSTSSKAMALAIPNRFLYFNDSLFIYTLRCHLKTLFLCHSPQAEHSMIERSL